MMPVTDCHRCGTLVAYDARLAEPRCTPCALAERDAALAVLRQLVAADDERKRLDGRVDLLTPETHRDWEMAYERADQAFDDAIDAARRLLAEAAQA